ncbi:MAG: Gfo/Idh/MocA family oxidoreductase [Pseudomonadota bacterium]
MAPVKLSVVGAGLVGQRHVSAIARTEGAVVASIVDPSDAARQFAKDGGYTWYPELGEMLAAEPPDGAIIATPNALHLPQGLKVLQAHVPALIEKPLADDVASAEQLVAQAAANSVPLLVGHHRRHNPIIQAAKETISSGALGEIVAVNGLCWLYKPDDYFNTKWRTQKGAGPVFINLIHDVDLMRHLVSEITSVQAFQANAVRGHEVEDTSAIVLRFANGALGTLSVSDTIVAPWSWELTAAENPAYPETAQNCYLIGGTHGSLELPGLKGWAQKEQRSWWEPIHQTAKDVKHADPLDVQIDHFCQVIRGDAQPLVSGADGLRSLQVISAIKQSADEGRAIELPLP